MVHRSSKPEAVNTRNGDVYRADKVNSHPSFANKVPTNQSSLAFGSLYSQPLSASSREHTGDLQYISQPDASASCDLTTELTATTFVAPFVHQNSSSKPSAVGSSQIVRKRSSPKKLKKPTQKELKQMQKEQASRELRMTNEEFILYLPEKLGEDVENRKRQQDSSGKPRRDLCLMGEVVWLAEKPETKYANNDIHKRLERVRKLFILIWPLLTI